MEESLRLLCSKAKLERDRGAEEMRNFLIEINENNVTVLQNKLISLLIDSESPWESKHGSLTGAIILLQDNRIQISNEFRMSIYDYAIEFLDDSEFRVRIDAGELLGVLCQRFGNSIYLMSSQKIMDGIITNLERQTEEEESKKLQEKLLRSQSSENDESETASCSDDSNSSQAFYDAAGWKALETWMKCLKCMIEGCGNTFNDFIDEQLLNLVFKTLSHTNRFVRETGYYVCSSLVACNTFVNETLVENNKILQHGDLFANHLCNGLSDNWSQVRLAASVATRNFFCSFDNDDIRKRFFPNLLPPLCLNRYYLAEGVRFYNHETWKIVTREKGKELVEEFIEPTVSFYLKQSEADNHAVREAVCACIAELGLKLEPDVVRPYVQKLLTCLLACFNDDSWPVRDTSCVACGNFVKCFPNESKKFLNELFPLFYENLQDSIKSVREGAALALSNVIIAYGADVYQNIYDKIKVGLENVETQVPNTDSYASFDKQPAKYGVIKKIEIEADLKHTNQQMYSCGSLAPKMHKGKRGAGCMHATFRKPSEPWEMADGCIHCVAEISALTTFHKHTDTLLPNVAKALKFTHFSQYVVLRESFCKRFVEIGRNLGKQLFKSRLELFYSVLFDTAENENELAAAAAKQCWKNLASFIGVNILKGRIEQYDDRLLPKFDRLMIS